MAAVVAVAAFNPEPPVTAAGKTPEALVSTTAEGVPSAGVVSTGLVSVLLVNVCVPAVVATSAATFAAVTWFAPICAVSIHPSTYSSLSNQLTLM